MVGGGGGNCIEIQTPYMPDIENVIYIEMRVKLKVNKWWEMKEQLKSRRTRSLIKKDKRSTHLKTKTLIFIYISFFSI